VSVVGDGTGQSPANSLWSCRLLDGVVNGDRCAPRRELAGGRIDQGGTLVVSDATREQIDSFTTTKVASASPYNAVRLRRAIESSDVRLLMPAG
jgi:hypothetical protein